MNTSTRDMDDDLDDGRTGCVLWSCVIMLAAILFAIGYLAAHRYGWFSAIRWR